MQVGMCMILKLKKPVCLRKPFHWQFTTYDNDSIKNLAKIIQKFDDVTNIQIYV